MPRVAKGYIEQLPSGSFRVSVYVGTDPLTSRQIRLRATAKTEQQARIELGRLLKDASEGRTPESAATVAKLLDEYAAIAPWDVSTRQTNEGFIRRTIKPALGHLEVRKVRGPILDQLYARLKRCGDLSCTGRPFTEHRNVPALVIKARDRRPTSQQVTEMLAEAIQSGSLAPGDELPSITELSTLQGIGTGVIRKALEALAADGLIIVRHGRATVVAGKPSGDPRLSRRRPGPGHDCRLAGCRPHVCHPNDAYLFSNDPAHSRPWNPDWVTHQIAAAADTAGVKLDIKGGRHYTASQLLAGGFDLRNTATRLGHSGGGATTLRHYADPVPEVDRRAAAYLAQLTARSTLPSAEP